MKIGIKDTGGSPFIVAELSANHRQDYNIAEKTVIAAAKAGADAVKLQTYTPDTITIDCSSELFQLPKNSLWSGKTLYELYGEAYTPWQWHEPLQKLAHSLGIELFSSPFDPTAADYLRKLGMPAYKIASFEIFDIPLIKQVASFGMPTILSTGMAGADNIQEAIDACRDVGNNNITLLKCTSAYPAPIDKANLIMIKDMKDRYGVLSGLSDHTEGMIAPITAAALGADMIEKHFILDKSLGGPDVAFSMIPDEFKTMADMVRSAHIACGKVDYAVTEEVFAMRKLARSLFVVQDMSEGDIFTTENLRSIRPGAGMHPRYLPEILGKKAAYGIVRGTPLQKGMVK